MRIETKIDTFSEQEDLIERLHVRIIHDVQKIIKTAFTQNYSWLRPVLLLSEYK